MSIKKRSQSNYENCCICNTSDNQVILIIDSLLKNMQKTVKNLNKLSANLQNTNIQFMDFGRLIKMIFGRRFKNLKITITCKHDSLKNQFMRKIECTQNQIDNLSHTLSWKLAKYNFHTDVVISQSKSFLRHITNLQGQKQSSSLSFSSVRSQALGIPDKNDKKSDKNREYDRQQNRRQFDYDHIQQQQNQNQHPNIELGNSERMLYIGSQAEQIQPHLYCVLPISWPHQHFMFPSMQQLNSEGRHKGQENLKYRGIQKEKQKQQQK